MSEASDIPSWCRVGAQCVCVNDDWSDLIYQRSGLTPPHRVPMLNEVLTIASVSPAPGYMAKYNLTMPAPALEFIGLEGAGYSAWNFRPLITRTQEQDIEEHFKPLIRQSVLESEDA